MATVSRSAGLLGGALVLSQRETAGAPRLRLSLIDAEAPAPTGALARMAGDNASAPMLPLFEALALRQDAKIMLKAGPGRGLQVEVMHMENAHMRNVHTEGVHA